MPWVEHGYGFVSFEYRSRFVLRTFSIAELRQARHRALSHDASPLADSCSRSFSVEREKRSSLNSDFLASKPLASSLYLPVSEAPCPHKRSISVTSLFPSPWLSISWTSRPCDWEGNRPGNHEPRSWRATSFRDTGPKLAGDPFRGLLAALDALGHADSVIGVAGERQTGVRGDR
jgi:hypothetical protein